MKPGLYYADGEQWGPLPAWARFFIAVGAYAAERPLGAERLVLGVSVPAREYSAAFAAFGVIRARSSLSAGSESPEEHLQRLCSFGDGTRLFYFSDNRKWEGIFRGCEVVEGETFIKVQLEPDYERAGDASADS